MNKTKRCNKCGEIKDVSDFHKMSKSSDGLKHTCKECRSIASEKYKSDKILKERGFKCCSVCGKNGALSEFSSHTWICKQCTSQKKKEHYTENKEIYSDRMREYREKNKNIIKIKKAEYGKKNTEQIRKYRNANRESIAKVKKLWVSKNKERIAVNRRAYLKDKRESDLEFKIKDNIRSRIGQAFRNNSGSKAYKTIELLGCTVQECINHLESQFTGSMSWGNHSKEGWHIDHIRPCASFDLTDPEQQKQCFHYTNLQPLWAEDNLRKSDKWGGE